MSRSHVSSLSCMLFMLLLMLLPDFVLSFWPFDLCVVFSLPELKAQVSLSDQNLSVVRRYRRRCRRCRKLFTLTSSPEQLDKFQPNMAQSILG